ncbi:MAG: glycoside hydrolase family 3 N-terminal domain-containing protein [Schaedlerella sp.]|uniref:glycoside hydrolase family 3 protein n=1 Tax=Mediterraneibacter glycyrrhizinilyticus TaxID=342942 RepID=UPI001D08DEDA|nr:glycoside hydrolase family 3 N-terminal domain-containing protein [Mediterraneibacter glycyrrhizinilyticus]MCB6310027.1 glycoside hydrolase family 3 protein [Lachnospiraceae bacterium 210521-DFI.1.109]MCB6427398.1 glycoside hydrolase family 3 protein [Mediterraneibacter glycyrrhizinilyticus]
MIQYKENPFYLTEEQVQWVESTYDSMSLEEKIGQLFCPIVFTKDEKELKELVETKHIGGMLYREGPGEELRQSHKILQDASRIPLLTASNLEYGGNGSAIEGTYYGREMLAAATGDVERAYQLGKVSCSEGAAVGVNWSFAPVVDLDLNYHNPITNVRTFGSNLQTVIDMGKAYIRGAKEEGVATSVKHFPGDGVDERDQHLVTSVNALSCKEWNESYGKIYKEMIEAGTLTVMAAHIALPAYEEYFDQKPCERILPATLSENLLKKLLREQLEFNGLIVTDATPMVGFCSAMDRATAVPLSIENGCDMFLFNRNMEEDFRLMREGYEKGILSDARLEEAVKRILATKAAMHLPEKQEKGQLVPDASALDILNCETYDRWAKECADEGVTLVKDIQKLLPIDPKKHKRVLLELMGDFPSNKRVCESFVRELEARGFEVTVYEPEGFEVMEDSVESFKSRYDLIFYVGNIETASNKTVSRLNWHTMFGLGNNMPWMVHEMPALFVSVGNPYHLLDAPMIKTFVNGYCNSEYVIHAVVEKLCGDSEFKGKSPIDPFCGKPDLKL